MAEDLERAVREALRGSLFRRDGRRLTIECETEGRADSLHGLLVRAEVRAAVAEEGDERERLTAKEGRTGPTEEPYPSKGGLGPGYD